MEIDWGAMKNAMYYHRTYTGDLSWQEWLLNEGGIRHTSTSVQVVDEKKYLLFLVKWA